LLPLYVDMSDRLAVIVGGGRVASRKAEHLVSAGLALRIISPAINEPLTLMMGQGRLEWVKREYIDGDLTHAALAVAATGDRTVNSRVAAEAKRLGILVNVADCPKEGNCTFPAILRRGRLEVAVSTGGASPAMASFVKGLISGVVDEPYGAALEMVADLREKLLTHEDSEKYNLQLVRKLMADGLMEHLRNRDTEAAVELLREAVEALGLDPDALLRQK